MRNLNLISNISRKKIMHFLDEEYGVNEVRLSKMSDYNMKAVLDFGAIYALLSGDSEITKKYHITTINVTANNGTGLQRSNIGRAQNKFSDSSPSSTPPYSRIALIASL